MKQSLLVFGLISILHAVSFAQDSTRFLINEYNVSFNRTTLEDANTEDRNGFGLGAYHIFMVDKKQNIVCGFEYNRTSQFIKTYYVSHFSHFTDVTYSINCFSIPLGYRLNFGSKTNFFIEAGAFADIVISSNRDGIVHTYLPDENYTENKFEEKARVSNSVGFYGGFGLCVPFSKFDLIVKPEYKFGLNKMNTDDILNRYFKINIGFQLH